MKSPFFSSHVTFEMHVRQSKWQRPGGEISETCKGYAGWYLKVGKGSPRENIGDRRGRGRRVSPRLCTQRLSSGGAASM